MNAKELRQFKDLLTAEREVFTKRLKHQTEEAEEYRQDVLEPLTESESNLLKKIDLALAKINDKTYGICSDCGQEIPRSRLRAKPSVSLCYDCQRKHESAA